MSSDLWHKCLSHEINNNDQVTLPRKKRRVLSENICWKIGNKQKIYLPSFDEDLTSQAADKNTIIHKTMRCLVFISKQFSENWGKTTKSLETCNIHWMYHARKWEVYAMTTARTLLFRTKTIWSINHCKNIDSSKKSKKGCFILYIYFVYGCDINRIFMGKKYSNFQNWNL